MIKEKHEKGSDSVKEEPGSSDKEASTTDVRIKKEDEAAGSNCAVKKEPGRPVTKNGGIIGSTNTGSLQNANERKTEGEEAASVADSANLTLKTEECIDNDLPGDAFSLGLSGPPPHPTPPEGVQPLASNVINKQPGNMEVQYMQQQSQIFVFSTVLANTGADEVMQGRYSSIIAYHCAQPGTKKYLEKNPLKVNQFNRQNPAQWLNVAMMKNKGCTRSPGLGPKTQPSIDNFLGPDGLDEIGLGDGDLPWDQKNNHHLEGLEGVSNGLPDVGPDMDACSPSLSNVQPSLQGVKVPDENLTPQQRQHREEQLATIRKMQQMLFPENQSMDGQPPGNTSAIDMPHNMMPTPPNTQLMSNQLEWLKMHQPKPVPIGPVSSGAPRGVPTGGPRLQGPPPPYHQTPRSASVPIALQSPSPASPNNPTSNLSLPSPRASSALNSPADPNRQFGLGRHVSTGQSPTSQDSPSAPRHNHSNPGTPVSSHLSPSVNSSNTEPTSTHQSSGLLGDFPKSENLLIMCFLYSRWNVWAHPPIHGTTKANEHFDYFMFYNPNLWGQGA